MSFADEVRTEVRRTINDMDKRFACLYGILLYTRVFTEEQICIQTESSEVSALVPELFSSVFGVKVQPSEKTENTGVSFNITDSELIKKIRNTYKIDTVCREINLRNIVNNSTSAFLAGAFFICGSVIDPNKEYHLEFVTPSELLCSDLNAILGSFGVSGKIIQRKKSYVLYIKDSECIEDTLTFMGAQQCSMDIMNVKIRKDMRNKANRLRNCDEANINKVVNAAIKQTEDIMLLKKYNEFENLSPEMREAAQLRLDNPELSLKEIGELLTEPIGRSGVNHRFKKIAAIAKELRENGCR
ncbi:MAG: DNA-binding protein WhiA [Oscillospiraceae bacterium]|nr:DNA-binding protein WhiA [Oscillospiraceae bacterium]